MLVGKTLDEIFTYLHNPILLKEFSNPTFGRKNKRKFDDVHEGSTEECQSLMHQMSTNLSRIFKLENSNA
jgi:hypothetical protein